MIFEIPDTRAVQTRAHQLQGRRDEIKSRLAQTQRQIAALENESELLLLVTELFRTFIDQEVTSSAKKVERLQTEGLQRVFNDQDLKVTAEIKVLRGNVSVDMVTTQTYPNGTQVSGVSGAAFGGAISTVQSVLLRLIVMIRRDLRMFMGLDEVLPAMEGTYVVNMGKFLSRLCDRLGLDILLVTHDPILVETADRAYRIEKRGDAAKFVLVKDNG